MLPAFSRWCSTWLEEAVGALSQSLFYHKQNFRFIFPHQNIFFQQRGEALQSNRQTVVQRQLGWCLHTSHVLFLSSAAFYFLVRGKPNNTWINACSICWSRAVWGDVDSSSRWKLLQSEQALAKVKWFVVCHLCRFQSNSYYHWSY